MLSNPELSPEQLAEHVDNWLAGYRSAHTAAAYQRDANTYLEWLAQEGLQFHEVRRREADRYRVYLETKGVNQKNGKPIAPSTIRRRIDGICAFYGYLVDEEEVFVRNPFKAVRRPPRDMQSRTIGLTVAEAGKLLAVATKSSSPIEGALLWLFISTGLRLAEVHNANLDSIHDGSTGMTISVRTKGDHADRKAIPGPAADAMRRYLEVREDCPSNALFVRKGQRVQREYIRDLLRRLCPIAGVPRISMHGLRHTCATLMLDTGASLSDVQMQLGHARIETTIRYDRARRARADKAGNALTAALTSAMAPTGRKRK